jgi:alkaline phosphatase D
MKKLLVAFFFVQTALAQLQSGPMVGYSEMREVLLWVQTKQAAKVKIMYWEQGNPAQKMSTDELTTQKKDAFVARLVADQVQPSKKYDYEVWLDGKKVNISYPLSFQSQVLWRWRAEPPAFKFAFGSCAYVNDAPYDRPSPYGGEYQIFTNIAAQKPDFMVWGGDIRARCPKCSRSLALPTTTLFGTTTTSAPTTPTVAIGSKI